MPNGVEEGVIDVIFGGSDMERSCGSRGTFKVFAGWPACSSAVIDSAGSVEEERELRVLSMASPEALGRPSVWGAILELEI
jgi:hypothetical protein